eukprot:3192108-Pyramimonas_sp.AAC.1
MRRWGTSGCFDLSPRSGSEFFRLLRVVHMSRAAVAWVDAMLRAPPRGELICSSPHPLFCRCRRRFAALG